MTKIYLILPILLVSTLAFSQDDAQGCDGERYLIEVFSNVDEAVVEFGANYDAAGNYLPLIMDIYSPHFDTTSKRPLIIWAFGGGFVGGEREDMELTCREFARRGFVSAACDYRLYPLLLGFPDTLGTIDMFVKSMHDMKAAIRYFRQDAATVNEHNIDPDRILIGGISAGAITALHTAYLDENDELPDHFMDILLENGGLEGNSGDAENLSYSSDVDFVVSLSGALYQKSWINAGEPQLVSIHGTEDEVVPYGYGLLSINIGITLNFNSMAGTGVLHSALDEFDIPNYHVPVVGGLHESTYLDPLFEAERQEFESEGALMIYNFLCPSTPPLITDAEELFPDQEIKLYPNPASSVLQIDADPDLGSYNVMLYDLLGRQVSIWPNQQGFASLERGDWPSGYYVLKIHGENWQHSQRVVW